MTVEMPTPATGHDRHLVVRAKLGVLLRDRELTLDQVAKGAELDLSALLEKVRGDRSWEYLDLIELGSFFGVGYEHFVYDPGGFAEYVVWAHHYRERHPHWRVGQACFNALDLARPELAVRVRGTSLDPFYLDERLPAFWDHVAIVWDC